MMMPITLCPSNHMHCSSLLVFVYFAIDCLHSDCHRGAGGKGGQYRRRRIIVRYCKVSKVHDRCLHFYTPFEIWQAFRQQAP